MSRLGRYKSTLKQWGLTENPFKTTPPDSIEDLVRVFYGREAELENAIPALYEGRNILIRGAWGVGKTALILTLLNCLQQEVAGLDEKMLVLYLDHVSGDSPIDFYRALLLVVADRFAESNKDAEARSIADTLRGRTGLQSKVKTEGKVTLGIASFGGSSESPDSTTIDDPYALLISILDKAQKSFDRIVLAVDDLDKKDVVVVQDILEKSLELFRRGEKRSFLMTGRGFTDLQEANLKALGIFSEDFTLQPMSQGDLYQIAINYLNLARETASDDPHPFTDIVLNLITENAQGIPRQLNVICEKVLRQAAMEGCEKLDEAAFMPIWRTLQQDVTYSLTPHLRQLIYIAYEAGGISEDIDDRYLSQMGVYTFVDLLPMLKTLEGSDSLIRQEDETGYRFFPSRLHLPPSEQNEP
ncbi:MAG: AAA family ATPase [Limnospira sp.]